MRKSLKKVLASMLILVLVFGVSACGGKKDAAANTTPTADPNQATTLPIVKDTLNLKFVSYNWGDANYGNDMAVFKELQKRTNIQLDWELLPADDNLTKLNLIMSSGQLPDIISYPDAAESKKLFDKYAAQGAIIPLDDLINQYAPHIKAMIDNPPFKIDNFKSELTSADGHIYSLPRLTEVTTGMVFCIRQDWLDKVGMKAPTTTDELYTVLKAFKDKNVNGKGNVVPLEPEPQTGVDGIQILMNAFGAHQGFYVDQKDNTIKYGPTESAYKDGLEFCAKLYKEGLIDKDYVSVTTDAFRTKVANNQIGMFYAWPLSGLGFNNTAVQKIDPKASYVGLLPVKGPKGDQFKENPQAAITPCIAITKSNKNPIETIKYLDYIYSKEGNILMNYGVQDKDYTLDASGNPVFTDYVLKNPDGNDAGTVRTNEGMQVGLPFIATLDSQSQATPSEVVRNVWKDYENANVLYPKFPNLPLTEEQNADISGTITDMKTYVEENTNKFVQGQTPDANYDKFVQTIKTMGVDNVLKVYNEAYKKYLELGK
jgi:putative aldouronate transport system substrate-binding protein